MPGKSLPHSKLSDVSASYDVVVIGAGAAGMSAALFSAIRGARTLLVEKTGFVGGTSALSAGSIWIPNTRHACRRRLRQRREGREISAADHRQPGGRRAARKFPESRSRSGRGPGKSFRGQAAGLMPRHPDYRSELEGAAVAGRALEPLPFDGRLLGEAFKLVRPPLAEFTLLGGMMVDRTDIGHLLSSTKSMKSLTHSAKLLARYARDRLSHGRGTRLVMGNALVGRLLVFTDASRCRYSSPARR